MLRVLEVSYIFPKARSRSNPSAANPNPHLTLTLTLTALALALVLALTLTHQVHGARVVRRHLELVRDAARPRRAAQGNGAARLSAPSRDLPQLQPYDVDLLHGESRGPAGVA